MIITESTLLGLFFVMGGISLLLKVLFNIRIPFLGLAAGLFLIYWGLTLLFPAHIVVYF